MTPRNPSPTQLASRAEPLTLDPWQPDYTPLLRRLANASIVLIGEASHGTEQFYRIRAELTQALISQYGFDAVAVEADWPDAYRVNRWVQWRGEDASPSRALGDFVRFPRWMWRNSVVADFIDWLRGHNSSLHPSARVGFYGLDLYSLFTSMEAVIDYLEEVDPEAAEQARYRYGCFDQFDRDPQRYGYSVDYGVGQDCEDETVAQLTALRRRAYDYLRRDGFVAEDELFYAEQNARLVTNAERYYREMFRGMESSWNLRDRHMFETLEALRRHLGRTGAEPKVVVWAHNSHLGDARHTEMSRRGELNLGQLVKESHPEISRSVGFTTATGTVSAATNWGEEMQVKRVRPPLEGSVEEALSGIDLDAFVLDLHQPEVREQFSERALERAIGVIYRPQTERVSHYFGVYLPGQFDDVIHVDQTTALMPLDPSPGEEGVPETYPHGV